MRFHISYIINFTRFQMPKLEGGARMLCLTKARLLIGTTMNSLLAVKISETEAPLQGAKFDDIPITQVLAILKQSGEVICLIIIKGGNFITIRGGNLSS